MASNRKIFRGKNFITFTILWSFLVMAFSGIILYIRPEGSLADEINWTFFGLTKKGWEGIHTIFVLFFILVASIHLFYNWKVLMNYFKIKISEGFIFKRELAASLAIVAFILISAIAQWQPFWKLLEWRAEIKQWDRGLKISSTIHENEYINTEVDIEFNKGLGEDKTNILRGR